MAQKVVAVTRPFGVALLSRLLGEWPKRREKRMLTVEAMEAAGIKHEFKNKDGSLEKLGSLLNAGYGVVGLTPHFSYGDFFRVISSLLVNCEKSRNREMHIPLALHQDGKLLMVATERFSEVYMSRIRTPDTKRKEAALHERGKKIPWLNKINPEDVIDYLRQAAKTLKAAGIVMVAPQGGRRGTLEPFEKEPVKALDIISRRARVEKVAYAFFGIEVPGLEDYGAKSKMEMHLGLKYIVTLGLVLTAGEFKARAAANGRTLDEEAYQIMLDLAPENYKPKQALASPVTIS